MKQSAPRRHIIDELADEADSPAHREKYNLVFLLLEHSAFGVSQTCEVFARFFGNVFDLIMAGFLSQVVRL